MAYDTYVKFLRGTPTTYQNLACKDKDTLYFISTPGSKEFQLYFGEKQLISNEDIGESLITLRQLQDVILKEHIFDKSFLVYNPSKQCWEDIDANKVLSSIVLEMKGATTMLDGQSGLVPTPKKGQQGCYLRGDGQWAEPVTKADRQLIYQMRVDIQQLKNNFKWQEFAKRKE